MGNCQRLQLIFNYFLSEHNKAFAFFVPDRFQQTSYGKTTSKQIAFYWINDDYLVTSKRSDKTWFCSSDHSFIEILGALNITNDRRHFDYAYLNTKLWPGMEQGICRHYFIYFISST